MAGNGPWRRNLRLVDDNNSPVAGETGMNALQTSQNMPELTGNALQRLIPINKLSAECFQLFFSQCELLPIRKGEQLFAAGDSDDRIYYLLEGKVELRHQSRHRSTIEAGHPLPLDPYKPHTMTIRALSAVTVLHCDRRWLDSLLLPPLLHQHDATLKDDARDWLQCLLATNLFNQLPGPNLQQVFSQCEPLAYGRGQPVIEQGGEDDGFYIIQSGHCEVVRLDGKEQVSAQLAQLGPGEWFGEVGCLTGCPSNVSIRMLDDGALLRLSRRGFDELIRRPLVAAVDKSSADSQLAEGAVWLDVRESEEAEDSPLDGGRHYAFSKLQQGIVGLESDRYYILVCDSGVRSAYAAMLLGMHGYSVGWLRGGLAALRGWHKEAAATTQQTDNRQDPLLQSLRADLTRLLRHVDNAMNIKRQAESARYEAECAARKQMEEERTRLRDQAVQVRNMLEQTQKLQKRLAEEKQRLHSGLKRREQAVEQRINNLNATIEKRVAEERERLEEEYQLQQTNIDRLSSAKAEVESRVQDDTASDADKERARQALETELEQYGQALREAENEREHVQAVAVTQELVSEIGQNLDANDQAKLAEYQTSQRDLSQRREQLENKARQLSAAVQKAQVEKQASAAVHDGLMREARQKGAVSDDSNNHNGDDALRAATARYNEAEAAHQEAVSAEQQNKTELVETQEAESELLDSLNAEIEGWLQEQSHCQPSAKQQEVVGRYEETMKRIKEHAVTDSEQERTRDDLLLSDINAELEQIAEQRRKSSEQ